MPDRRTYILDTSVLLAAGPDALAAFDEHDVVLPIAVLEELEAKRNHPDLGWAARETLRTLERLRTTHGTLTDPAPVNDLGGTVRVELNCRDQSCLPAAMRRDDPDTRILAVAGNLGDGAVLVTKDLPLRLRADAAGVAAADYLAQKAPAGHWTGLVHAHATQAQIATLFSDGLALAELADAPDIPVNSGVTLAAVDGTGSALARLHADKVLRPVNQTLDLFGNVSPRSAPQSVAADLLTDDDVGIVSLAGAPGTGKSTLALAAALAALRSAGRRDRIDKIVVIRPLAEVGGESLGFLPGDVSEKMGPVAAAIDDTLRYLDGGRDGLKRDLDARGQLEVIPVSHLRGRTLTRTALLVDDAQNLEASSLMAAISRAGTGSRVFLTWDAKQRDSLRVDNGDGVEWLVAKLAGEPLFGHVELTRSERSPIAGLIGRISR